MNCKICVNENPPCEIGRFSEAIIMCPMMCESGHRGVRCTLCSRPVITIMSSVKLSPVLKQLLAQRHPQSFASPPKHILYSVLEHTRAEAKEHDALNGWLVLSVTTPSLLQVIDS